MSEVAQVDIVSANDLAELLLVTDRRVQQLAGMGVITKVERGKYDLRQSIQGYIRFLNTMIPNKQLDGPAREVRAQTEEHRSVLMQERARMATLNRLEKEGLLVNKEQERRAAFKLGRTVRNSMMNIPARVAPGFAATQDSNKIYRSLEKEIIMAMEDVADMVESGEGSEDGFVHRGGEDCLHWCGL